MWENFKRASKLIFRSNIFMAPKSVQHSLSSSPNPDGSPRQRNPRRSSRAAIAGWGGVAITTQLSLSFTSKSGVGDLSRIQALNSAEGKGAQARVAKRPASATDTGPTARETPQTRPRRRCCACAALVPPRPSPPSFPSISTQNRPSSLKELIRTKTEATTLSRACSLRIPHSGFARS